MSYAPLYIFNRPVSDLEVCNVAFVLLHAQLKVYFNVGELDRFVLDQDEVAATPHNLTIVNNALNSAELKVPSVTSTRQRGQLRWTAFLKINTTCTDEWVETITFKDYAYCSCAHCTAGDLAC